jgi:hypothetical protein
MRSVARKFVVFNLDIIGYGATIINMNTKRKWKNPSRTKIYYVWRNMRYRCLNKRCCEYHNYGGRGIKICDRWINNYDNFYEDMHDTYKEGISLDRIDVDGDYSPDNCKWSTCSEQSRNKRNTILVNGISIAEHAESMDVTYDAVWKRIKKYGISPEEAINPQRRNLPSKAECGTRSRYERDGCRCKKCRAFNSKRASETRRKRKERKVA